MHATPLVGVIADRKIIEPHPFHVVGEKYLTAVIRAAGALPVALPALRDELELEALLRRLDGVLLTGSPSNVEPHRYRGAAPPAGTLEDPARDALAFDLIPKALERGMPIFGICRGFQEMNVALGGSLHQAVHRLPGYLMHKENPEDPLEKQYGPAHEVSFTPGGYLARLTGAGQATVNSVHGQGVDELAERAVVEATAPDGLVEAFVVDDAPGFALAVQWHPEWRADSNPVSRALFRAFGDACRRYAERDTV